MAFAAWLVATFRSWRGGADRGELNRSAEFEALVRAQGDWLALLATILEREGIIAGDELARVLREFAELTAADRPTEGHILSLWAAHLHDAALAFRDLQSLH